MVCGQTLRVWKLNKLNFIDAARAILHELARVWTPLYGATSQLMLYIYRAAGSIYAALYASADARDSHR